MSCTSDSGYWSSTNPSKVSSVILIILFQYFYCSILYLVCIIHNHCTHGFITSIIWWFYISTCLIEEESLAGIYKKEFKIISRQRKTAQFFLIVSPFIVVFHCLAFWDSLWCLCVCFLVYHWAQYCCKASERESFVL